MTLKTKLRLGISFVFLLTMLIGFIAIYSIEKLSSDTKIILEDNYESIEYVEDMRMAFDEKNWKKFELNLQKQETNITEEGEGELTRALRTAFKDANNDSLSKKILPILAKISEINRVAIQKKHRRSQETIQSLRNWIGLLVAFCILVGLTFIINFSDYITAPIKELTEAIQAISNKNYEQRIRYKRSDEFGTLSKVFNEMAQQLENWENSNLAKIIFEKKRVETIIESLKDATIGIDENGIILFANQQALKLLNLKESDIVARKTSEVTAQNDLFRHLLKDEEVPPIKIVIDGKESYFTVEKIVIHQDAVKLGHVIVLKNITSFKELDLAKTHFIATISHELKTPIASTDLSLKLLQDTRIGELNEKQNQIIENIKSDTQRLVRIVGELLDLSQVESGQLNLNLKPTKPNLIVERATSAIITSANEKQISINTNLTSNDAQILVDEEKLTWVLVNFLTNAIRYSNFGETIEINGSFSNEIYRIAVRDFGKGITKEQESHLFDRYYKGTDSSVKQTGLGLAISKEFVEVMNGKIGVLNHQKGVEFFVEFDKC
ncbi:MAG: ATP-binding protein [Spirosomataceae bacterium]